MSKNRNNALLYASLQQPALLEAFRLLGLSGPNPLDTVETYARSQGVNEAFLRVFVASFLGEDRSKKDRFPSYNIQPLMRCCAQFLEGLKGRIVFLEEDSDYRTALEQLHVLLMEQFLPHAQRVYELYYSPAYTAGMKSGLGYSVEYFDARPNAFEYALLEAFPRLSLDDQRQLIELHRDLNAWMRLVGQLLQPLILEMEEQVVRSRHRSVKDIARTSHIDLKATLPSDGLTQRERETLRWLVMGLTNKEIAEQMHVALTTVISHRRHLIQKLGIRSLSGLTVYALTHGYLSEEILINED